MGEGWLKAKVINRKMLTDSIMEITIETYQEMNVIPGQWALFSFEDNQWPFQRCYSIVDQDTDNERTMLIFAIKFLDNGRWGMVIKNTHIGDEVTIKWIFGNFILQNTQLPKVFIWTGIGITPLINMAKYCTTQKQLFFSVSYKNELFYEDRIKKIHDLNYKIYLSREDTSGYPSWTYTTWRIDIDKEYFDPDTEFYVCWKPEIVEDIDKRLKKSGYKKIYSESF